MFNAKDPILMFLKFFVVYKFVFSDCNACYFRQTTRHLSARIKGHLGTDKKPHSFGHFVSNETCKALVLKIALKYLIPPLLHLG